MGDTAWDGVSASARTIMGGDSATAPQGHENHTGQRHAQRDYGQQGILADGGSPPPVTADPVTADDSPGDWLRAGQALDRLLLQAASLRSQPLESPGWQAEVQHAGRAVARAGDQP